MRTSEQASEQAMIVREKVLEFCATAKTRDEIQKLSGISSRRYFIEKILNPLIEDGLIKMIIPDKPTSSKQKYYSIKK